MLTQRIINSLPVNHRSDILWFDLTDLKKIYDIILAVDLEQLEIACHSRRIPFSTLNFFLSDTIVLRRVAYNTLRVSKSNKIRPYVLCSRRKDKEGTFCPVSLSSESSNASIRQIEETSWNGWYSEVLLILNVLWEMGGHICRWWSPHRVLVFVTCSGSLLSSLLDRRSRQFLGTRADPHHGHVVYWRWRICDPPASQRHHLHGTSSSQANPSHLRLYQLFRLANHMSQV